MHPNHVPASVTETTAFPGGLDPWVAAFPRALLLDARLTPLERNTWLVFRELVDADGISALPTYNQLRPYLACLPHTEKASCETVHRAVMTLRLSGWISLVSHRRDPMTGHRLSNHYAVHTTPLPFPAIADADPSYLDLLDSAFDHASYAIRKVASHLLTEIARNPNHAASLPSSLMARLPYAQQFLAAPASPEDGDGPPSPPSEGAADTELEPSHEAPSSPVPNPKHSTVRTNTNTLYKNVLTYCEAKSHRLRLPDRFQRLPAADQRQGLTALSEVDNTLQQAVLDEWSARCERGQVRHPIGYLFGLIRRAIQGQFKLWAARVRAAVTATPAPAAVSTSPAPATPPSSPKPKPSPNSPVAQEHLAELRRMFRLPRADHGPGVGAT